MVELSALDKRIESLPEWIMKAGKSLIPFYNNDTGHFWRDTYGRNQGDKENHPTSSTRSFFALYEFLRFLYEEDMKDTDLWKEVVDVLKNFAKGYLSQLPSNKDIRKSPSNDINMFTDGNFLVAVSVLDNLQRLVGEDLNVRPIQEAALTIADEKMKQLKEWGGGKVYENDEIHHFVTLHAVRGLDACSVLGCGLPKDLVSSLARKIEEDTQRLLACHFAGLSSKFDPTELAFDIALLNRFSAADAPRITERSVECITNTQTKGGSWPTSRYISTEGHGLLHVASYEVALTLTQLLIRKVNDKDSDLCEMLLLPLSNSFELVKSNYTITEEASGWANDHARREGLIESWATAIVLLFLIYYREALMSLRQRIVLENRGAICFNALPFTAWPDMAPAVRKKGWIAFSQLDSISDPTDGNYLTESIRDKLVKPISEDWAHRPPKKVRPTSTASSIVLFGPTGTRKTTMVETIAQTLGWPLLTIAPTDFLTKGGLEGFESARAEIFDDLFRLRRVVVLFDDVEELVRARGAEQKVDSRTAGASVPLEQRVDSQTTGTSVTSEQRVDSQTTGTSVTSEQRVESRTTGAFVTSGMLSPLQKLRKKNWVVLFLATNTELKRLDEAVVRLGRFDAVQMIDYPTLDAQRRYVKKKTGLGKRSLETIQEALSDFDTAQKSVRNQAISFSDLDELIEEVKAVYGDNLTKQNVSDILTGVIQKSPRTLY